jgi:hypothetical protein
MTLLITPAGNTISLHSDDFDFTRIGAARIQRASNVEPCDQGWQADLSPVNGPILGPYAKRRQALQAEIDWIERNLPSISQR